MLPVIDSRTKARFQLEITKFSKFKESLLSRSNFRPTLIGNLPWKISVMSLWDIEIESFVLGIFLQCDIENTLKDWSANVEGELKLLNLKNHENDKVFLIKCLFKEKENSWGYSPFITINNVINNGFYDEINDAITVEACITLNLPF